MMQTLPQKLSYWQVQAAFAILGITKRGKIRSILIENGQVTVVELQHESEDGTDDPASWCCFTGSYAESNVTTVTTQISIERVRL